MKIRYVITAVLFAVTISAGLGYSAGLNAEMTKYLQELEAQSTKQESGFTGFDAERGKELFFAMNPNEKVGMISCATCHTPDLKNSGKTLVGKVIEPLAPSVNKKRLTDAKDTEKWLTRNFKQVYGREGTPREKGDVLTFIGNQ